jgi:predicted MFS family arabinose efflux permease
MKHSTPMIFQIITFSLYRMINFTGIRMVFPFLTVLSRGMGTSVEMISIAVSVASMSTICAPFLAQIGERFGKRTGMISGLLIFITSGFIIFFMNNFAGFFIGTVLMQLAINMFSPSMQAYLSDHISFEKRGMALSITELGWPLSYLIIVPLIALRIEQWGWNTVFLFFSVVSIIFLGLIFFQVKKDTAIVRLQEKYSLPFKQIFRSGNAVLGLVIGFCMISANIIIQLVFGIWLETDFSASITQLGLVSAVIGAAETTGILISAIFIDRIGKRRALFIGSIFCVILTAVSNVIPFNLHSATIWLVLFYFFSEFTIVSTLTFVSELYPQARTTYMALYAMMNAVGFGVASLLAPIAYRYTIHGNMITAMVMCICMVILLGLVKHPEKGVLEPVKFGA